jgi:hypothetical protein
VVGGGDAGSDCVEDARGVEALAFLHHGSRQEEGAPVEARLRGAHAHHPVTQLVRDGEPLRSVSRHDDRYLDGAFGGHAAGVTHLDLVAVDDGAFAAQQRAQRADVLLHELPAECAMAEHAAAGEARTEGVDHAARREMLDRRQCRRRHQGVAQARNRHGAAHLDAVGALGDARQGNP